MAEHGEPYEIDVGERAVGEAIVNFGLLPGLPLMVIEITGSVLQSEGFRFKVWNLGEDGN